MSRTFIIDSRNRVNGVPTNHFTLNLSPVLSDVRGVKLAYASIPVIEGSDQLYWCISIPELGLHARGSNGDSSKCTFSIPITSGGGYRSFFNSMSSYEPIAHGNGGTLTQINVRLHYPDGSLVSTNGEEILIILQLE